MRTKYNKFAIVVALTAIALSLFLWLRLERVTEERNKARESVHTLSVGIEQYVTESGKNAAVTNSIYTDLQSYKKLHADDAQIIKELRNKQKQLANVIATRTRTEIPIQTIVKDSLVYIADTIKVTPCFEYADNWININGCIDDKVFKGNVIVVDSLLVTETIKYKRFLFWKTRKEKERTINVVSRNPYTIINNIESVVLRK